MQTIRSAGVPTLTGAVAALLAVFAALYTRGGHHVARIDHIPFTAWVIIAATAVAGVVLAGRFDLAKSATRFWSAAATLLSRVQTLVGALVLASPFGMMAIFWRSVITGEPVRGAVVQVSPWAAAIVISASLAVAALAAANARRLAGHEVGLFAKYAVFTGVAVAANVTAETGIIFLC
jgi:hypothetical protein